MLNNRISLDVAYYNTLDYNNILRFPGSQTSGFATEVVNGNKYTTNGVDISLSLVPIKNSNFQWKSLLNWSKSVQKITEIYQEEITIITLSLTNVLIVSMVTPGKRILTERLF